MENNSKFKERLLDLQDPNRNKKPVARPVNLDKWAPPVGTSTVRIVQPTHNRDSRTAPFTELMIHYNIGRRTMASLTNYGEKDTIIEFTQALRKTPDWKMARDLEPKMRVFVPVIVRGEEERGVRLWDFGKKVYESLLLLMSDEDLGDITDPMNGHDIKVDTTSPEQNGSDYSESKVTLKIKPSPLSDDAAKIKEWLEKQPNPLDSFTKHTYEEMKAVLTAHLDPENAKAPAKTSTPAAEEVTITGPAPKVTANVPVEAKGDLPWEGKGEKESYTLNTAKGKSKKAQDIDELFKI